MVYCLQAYLRSTTESRAASGAERRCVVPVEAVPLVRSTESPEAVDVKPGVGLALQQLRGVRQWPYRLYLYAPPHGQVVRCGDR